MTYANPTSSFPQRNTLMKLKKQIDTHIHYKNKDNTQINMRICSAGFTATDRSGQKRQRGFYRDRHTEG